MVLTKLRMLLRPGNLVLGGGFILLLAITFWGYARIKGPISEGEIRAAQAGASRFQQGQLEIKQGRLLSVENYFFVGTVYNVKDEEGTKRLISFVTPMTVPKAGNQVEWVGVGNYASTVTEVAGADSTIEGDILTLERISPKNNSMFYMVVHSSGDEKVARFIIDSAELSRLTTLNSVRVTYRSPMERKIELSADKQKVMKGFIRDLWLTSKRKALELERNFDYDKYPFYMSVAPGENAKYTWIFYLTKEQRDQLKLGNVIEINYSSAYPASIKVLSSAVDKASLNELRQ